MKATTETIISVLAQKLEYGIDGLVDAMFSMLAQDPALEAFFAPEMEHIGRTIARADLLDEIHALGRGCDVPQRCPDDVEQTARRTAELGAPVTVPLQCYRAGHRVLSEALQQEVDQLVLTEDERKAVLDRTTGFLFDYADRCSAFVVEHHTRYRDVVLRAHEHRQLTAVRRLLAGDQDAAANLGYRLERWHLAVIGVGADLGPALERITAALGRSPLVIWLGDGSAWAWYPANQQLQVPAIDTNHIHATNTAIGVGSSGHGLAGFRRTHRQARQALNVALRRGNAVASYRDTGFEALLLADEQRGLDYVGHELAALDRPKPTRAPLRETLRVYFACGQSMAAAAARLGIHERTVSYRLGIAEARLGYPVNTRRTELDAALRLEKMHATRDKAHPGT